MPVWLNNQQWTSNSPIIRITSEYVIGTRTASTVQVRIKVSATLTGTNPSFGYNILGDLSIAGTNRSSGFTIKGTTPSKWDTVSTYLPSSSGYYTVSASSQLTSLSVSLRVYSSGSSRNQTYTGTITIPIGDTPPYWSGVGGNRLVKVNGILSTNPKMWIGENVTSIALSWSAAKDDQGDTIKYRIERKKASGSSEVIASGITGTSYTDNIGSNNAGAIYVYYITCYTGSAPNDDSDVISTPLLYINKLTPASNFAISSVTGGLSSGSFTYNFSWTPASNLNGVSNISYRIDAKIGSTTIAYKDGITSASTSLTINISTIASYVKNSGYTGTITFVLTSKNGYGSSGTTSVTRSVDLRTTPDPPTNVRIHSATNPVTVGDFDYYVPGKTTITIAWNEVTFSGLGGHKPTVTYYLLGSESENGPYNINLGNTTSSSKALSLSEVTSKKTLYVKVKAVPSYGNNYASDLSDYVFFDLHYYRPYTLKVTNVVRQENSVSIYYSYQKNSSIDSVDKTSFQYSLNPPSTKYDISGQSPLIINNLLSSKSYTVKLELKDNAGSVTTLSVPIQRYLPFMTYVSSSDKLQINSLLEVKNIIIKGTEVPNGTDLDTLTAPGRYYQNYDNQTDNNIHMPIEGRAFTMDVVNMGNWIQQRFYVYNSTSICLRTWRDWNNAWTNWYKFSGVEIPES